MRTTVWYHDPTEVDPATSWTGLVPELRQAGFKDITTCTVPAVVALFGYARPDAVIDIDGVPVVSIEQTKMNPSGHNLPQRFSCLLKASELGVAGILYHPEYARRTFSDPNPRYTNPRVALAQLRMGDIFPNSPPSLSVFWPTDPATLLPDTSRAAQSNLATIVGAILRYRGVPAEMKHLPEFASALSEMRRAVAEYGTRIRTHREYRTHFPTGQPHCITTRGDLVDPPPKARFLATCNYLDELIDSYGYTQSDVEAISANLPHALSLVFPATANNARNDSEHPWPGYFSLLDVLYARTGPGPADRRMNLVYELPVDVDIWLERLPRKLAQMRTVDALADVVLLTDGVVAGRSMGTGANLLARLP